MKQTIAVIGIGNLGGVFSQAFLRLGHPVVPVLRGMDIAEVADAVPNPALVLVAVGEEDLHPVLGELPGAWRDRVALLQNELMPRDWEMFDLPQPTVAVVWFEKRQTMPATPYYPNPVYGPRADLMLAALEALDMPALELHDPGELLFELVRKNLYIVSKNIMGLVAEGTVGEVWDARRDPFERVAGDVLTIHEWLAGEPLPRQRLLEQLAHDIEALPDKGLAGSSAPARLRRMLMHASAAGLDVPALREIDAARRA